VTPAQLAYEQARRVYAQALVNWRNGSCGARWVEACEAAMVDALMVHLDACGALAVDNCSESERPVTPARYDAPRQTKNPPRREAQGVLRPLKVW
jgi:hypothetical protein